MTRTRALLAGLLAGCLLGILPPPLDPWGAWMCCDSAGNCVIAVGSCNEGDWLVWCKVTGTGPTGATICLD